MKETPHGAVLNLILRKASAFDKLVEHTSIDPSYRGMVAGNPSQWLMIRCERINGVRWTIEETGRPHAEKRYATLLEAVEAMEEKS